MNTGTTLMPMAISYEIICALLRMPPRKGYLELLAYPASTMPYTLRLTMPKVYRMPTFRSAMTAF